MDKAAVTSAAAPTAPQRESGRWSLTAARRIPCRAPPRSLAGEAAGAALDEAAQPLSGVLASKHHRQQLSQVRDGGPLGDHRPDLAKVQPGGEVGAVGVQHADAGLGVLAKALVGSGQLLERGQIDGVALIQGRSSSPRLPVAIEASLRFERIADAAHRLDDTVGLASTPKVAWV